ncbi:MAG: hypothetical protein ABH878_10685, partial [bacterium]
MRCLRLGLLSLLLPLWAQAHGSFAVRPPIDCTKKYIVGVDRQPTLDKRALLGEPGNGWIAPDKAEHFFASVVLSAGS